MPVAQSQYREEKVNVIYFSLYSDFEIKYLPVRLPEAEGITGICTVFYLGFHFLIKNKYWKSLNWVLNWKCIARLGPKASVELSCIKAGPWLYFNTVTCSLLLLVSTSRILPFCQTNTQIQIQWLPHLCVLLPSLLFWGDALWTLGRAGHHTEMAQDCFFFIECAALLFVFDRLCSECTQ